MAITGDSHIHIFMNGSDYKSAAAMHSFSVNNEDIRAKLRAYANLGVTFLRDGGDPYGASIIASKLAPEYGITYLTPGCAIYKNGSYGGIVGKGFDTFEGFTGLVDSNIENGCSFIKIMASGILDFNNIGAVSYPEPLSMDYLIKMAEYCHSRGMAVMAHVNTDKQIRNCITAGFDSIEHGFYIEQDTLLLMKETSTIWIPTLSACGNLLGKGRFSDETVKTILKGHMLSVGRALALGVNVGLGSDAGAFGVNHTEGIETELSYLKASLSDRINEAQLLDILTHTQNRIFELFG